MDFSSSILANIVSDLVAGTLLAVGAYFLITYRLEVVRPLREIQMERKIICGLVASEIKGFLAAFERMKDERFDARVDADTWEAIKGSQAVRSLPLKCLELVLRAYSGIYAVRHQLERIQMAELMSWSADSPQGQTGSSIYVNNLKVKLRWQAEAVGIDCAKALEALQEDSAG